MTANLGSHDIMKNDVAYYLINSVNFFNTFSLYHLNDSNHIYTL